MAMEKMIFKPLDMCDTFVYNQDSTSKKVTPSYLSNGTIIDMGHLDAVYGDKNIYSTPRDLLKFDKALYNPEYLTADLVKEIYAPYSFENKGEKNYGLGIRMILQKGKSPFYYHNGWWHGNTSAYIHLKEEQVVIIALSNKYSKKPFRAKILSTYFGNYPFKDDLDLE
jgi:CubicO group peptidase (beta-lactamase class C family)